MKPFLRRLSIYGDFWLRYLHWGTRYCPWFLEPVFVFAFTVMFWLVLGKTRNAVARNLAVILAGGSPLINQLRVFRVFWNFAWTMVDAGHVRHGEDCIRWEVRGMRHLKDLENSTHGAILITAHMGNYDVAAPLFAKQIHKLIHLVRSPERQRESQEFEKAKRDQQVTGNFVIHYNEPGNMLGVTLARAIDEGGIVAVQGDRILFDVSPMKVPFKERVDWQVPRGPFTLALVAKVPIHPVFIIRVGWRRYEIQAEPPIVIPRQDRDRESVQAEAAKKWTSMIRSVAERHWRQWFVFEEMFHRRENDAKDEMQGAEQEDRKPQAQIDLVIPSKSLRGLGTVFAWNLLAGGWTSAVVLRRLLEWAVGDEWRVAGVLVAWPLVWFGAIVLVLETVLALSVVLAKLSGLPARGYGLLTCGLTLGAFGIVAWSELRGGCPVGWWLGVLGFAGIGAGLLQDIISRTARE